MTTPTLSFDSTVDETWQEHGLLQRTILYNGSKSGSKMVTRLTPEGEEEKIAIVGERYRLLPNEEAIKYADQAAEVAGFVPSSPKPF
jgi:hypothetical protein